MFVDPVFAPQDLLIPLVKTAVMWIGSTVSNRVFLVAEVVVDAAGGDPGPSAIWKTELFSKPRSEKTWIAAWMIYCSSGFLSTMRFRPPP